MREWLSLRYVCVCVVDSASFILSNGLIATRALGIYNKKKKIVTNSASFILLCPGHSHVHLLSRMYICVPIYMKRRLWDRSVLELATREQSLGRASSRRWWWARRPFVIETELYICDSRSEGVNFTCAVCVLFLFNLYIYMWLDTDRARQWWWSIRICSVCVCVCVSDADNKVTHRV